MSCRTTIDRPPAVGHNFISLGRTIKSAQSNLKLCQTVLESLGKVWRKFPDGTTTEQKDLNFDLPRLQLFISSSIKDLKKTDQRRVVDWQGGQLTCEVFEGSARFEHKVCNDETHYLLSVHDKVPFGVAAATLDVVGDDGVTGTVEFRITDFGTNATSELPDLK